MSVILKKIKLRYSKFELYILIFLLPFTGANLILIINHQIQSAGLQSKNSQYNASELTTIRTSYTELETLSYKVIGNEIHFIHSISLAGRKLDRAEQPKVEIIGNKIYIKEFVIFSNLDYNASNLLDYIIYNINPNALYELKLISESNGEKAQIININLDLKSQKNGLIILNNESEVFKNLKYFVNNTLKL
jgi:hypothetical protein